MKIELAEITRILHTDAKLNSGGLESTVLANLENVISMNDRVYEEIMWGKLVSGPASRPVESAFSLASSRSSKTVGSRH